MSPSISVRFLATQTDARLIALARDGHERAFEALVTRHRAALLTYCRRLLLPEGRAEDALQQGLLQAWLALRAGTEVRDARAWLYRIVHNTALNMLRLSGYDYSELHESLSGGTAPQDDLDRRIAVRSALAGIASLPVLQREELLRTAVEGQSYDVVAGALGVTDGAVRGLVQRARVTLRAAATAITPMPLLNWLISAEQTGAPLAARLPEIAAGTGTVGVGALLTKAGAVAVTAGALAGGVTATHALVSPHHAQASRAVLLARGSTAAYTAVAVAGGQPAARPKPPVLVSRRHPSHPSPRIPAVVVAAPIAALAPQESTRAPAAGGPTSVPSSSSDLTTSHTNGGSPAGTTGGQIDSSHRGQGAPTGSQTAPTDQSAKGGGDLQGAKGGDHKGAGGGGQTVVARTPTDPGGGGDRGGGVVAGSGDGGGGPVISGAGGGQPSPDGAQQPPAQRPAVQQQQPAQRAPAEQQPAQPPAAREPQAAQQPNASAPQTFTTGASDGGSAGVAPVAPRSNH